MQNKSWFIMVISTNLNITEFLFFKSVYLGKFENKTFNWRNLNLANQPLAKSVIQISMKVFFLWTPHRSHNEAVRSSHDVLLECLNLQCVMRHLLTNRERKMVFQRLFSNHWKSHPNAEVTLLLAASDWYQKQPKIHLLPHFHDY